MMTCNGCRFAAWQRTKTGALHPSGDGKCTFNYTPKPYPAYMGNRRPETIEMFYKGINRRTENKVHCPYYAGGAAPIKGGADA